MGMTCGSWTAVARCHLLHDRFSICVRNETRYAGFLEVWRRGWDSNSLALLNPRKLLILHGSGTPSVRQRGDCGAVHDSSSSRSATFAGSAFPCLPSPSSRSSRPWWSEWSACVLCSARRRVRPNTSSPPSSTAPSAVDRAPNAHDPSRRTNRRCRPDSSFLACLAVVRAEPSPSDLRGSPRTG
jgi:hypothetical protein